MDEDPIRTRRTPGLRRASRLISKGLLYTPRYGYAKFTVPQFDQFMVRYMSLESVPPA